jgi:beta-lactamase regulating signal transducer with metallopeptidase domain
MSTTAITTWLLTYLIHSTVLLGATWLATRILGDRRLALQETLLRIALIGGLLTSTLQVGFGIEPIGGELAIADFSQSEVVAASAVTSVVAGDIALSPTPALSSRTLDSWPAALLSLWAVGSMLALLVLGRSIVDLRRLLKTRRFRPTGRLLEHLALAMGLRKSVRLSTSAAIAVPFATGIKDPEICCPERVGDLAFEHQKSLFAHELAHLARRDPAWQLLYRFSEAILFLQPLNRLVRRRLEEIAEHLTDERAVACTGDRLGLARCLVVVAHWGISDAPGLPATAFASSPRLDRRVRHLISGAIGQHRNARWTAPLLAALVVGSVVLLPAIAPSAVHADISPTFSEVKPPVTWSTFVSDADAEAPSAPALPEVPPAARAPRSVAPVTDSAPSPDVVPRSPAEPRPVSAPAPSVEPAPEATPDSNAEPTAPSPPTAPEPPSKTDKPAPEEPTLRERAWTQEEARARHREAQRERSEAQARAREQMHLLATEARDLAREAAERCRLTEAERRKLRDEARELRGQAEAEARDHLRQAREHMRLTDAEREELRHRAEELHAEHRELAREMAREAREQWRELAERARRLAEEAEAERQVEEEQRPRKQTE